MILSFHSKIEVFEKSILFIQFPFLFFALFFGVLKFKRYYVYGQLINHYSKSYIDHHFPMNYIDGQITKFTLIVLALNFVLTFIRMGKPISFE